MLQKIYDTISMFISMQFHISSVEYEMNMEKYTSTCTFPHPFHHVHHISSAEGEMSMNLFTVLALPHQLCTRHCRCSEECEMNMETYTCTACWGTSVSLLGVVSAEVGSARCIESNFPCYYSILPSQKECNVRK